jgi:hypothetical protein
MALLAGLVVEVKPLLAEGAERLLALGLKLAVQAVEDRAGDAGSTELVVAVLALVAEWLAVDVLAVGQCGLAEFITIGREAWSAEIALACIGAS